MRSEFEKLPEVEEGLRHCHYVESTNNYHADAAHVEEFEWHTQFVNGAWYAFQEQQKKIDAIKKHIISFHSEGNLWGFDSDQALNQIELIGEILK